MNGLSDPGRGQVAIGKGGTALRFPIKAFLLCLMTALPMFAGPVLTNTWYQFATSNLGVASGCLPADPNGLGCAPGDISIFADVPAWTFVAPAGGATLLVTDGFTSGDVLDVFDFGALIGTTTVVSTGAGCGNNVLACLANPLISSGSFSLAPGAHSITFAEASSSTQPSGSSHFFNVSTAAVPEPSTWALMGLGMLEILRRRRKG